jgi:hypothetical protein
MMSYYVSETIDLPGSLRSKKSKREHMKRAADNFKTNIDNFANKNGVYLRWNTVPETKPFGMLECSKDAIRQLKERFTNYRVTQARLDTTTIQTHS